MGTEILEEVFEVIKDRCENPLEESYVSYLMDQGKGRILDKVREESLELIEAADEGSSEDVIHESADTIFHVMVLLASEGIEFEEVMEELRRRRQPREAE